ncbi:MAG: hypothetical protein ACD_2C00037G0005 [uncultured bacterium (gcode 4)]|uniref:Uncharacterized protein n=1 Tax=uncultured bacterium (gcode 4) TaxID=1234023 RepID=K2FGA9_9BACT|nr:MAG: hypothetical protein ACD_2C00037G0005 [uncultured bacterium (gcode 4)]
MDIRQYFTKKSNSTVKFDWDFEPELKKTIDFVELEIEKNLVKSLKIESIIIWKNNLKIKITDNERMIFRSINCVFRYDNEDKWFWICHIEFAISELSEKPRLHYVWKFTLNEKEKIKEKILKDLVMAVERIY